MDRFIKDLTEGNIHLRDKWQIELKSEFVPNPKIKNNSYTQTFYLFIPNSLQINEETYPKSQFYSDRTIFLRYKTPEFTLNDLYNPDNPKSPLTKLRTLINRQQCEESCLEVENELKLLGNIIRSSTRKRVKEIVYLVRSNTPIKTSTQLLSKEIDIIREAYFDIQNLFRKKWRSETLNTYFFYVDEFISTTINYYLTGLLSEIRDRLSDVSSQSTEPLCYILEKERQYRKRTLHEPSITDEDSISNEFILYRSSLLNKYILDALLLNTRGSTVKKKYGNLIGSISAGIAMLFFFVLFVYQTQVLINNSLPFILLTVVLYILKDRIKESLKKRSYKGLSRWFYDYQTEIFSPDNTQDLGKLNESMAFLEKKDLSKDIQNIRNREFHEVLETIKRPEQIIYYKKILTLFKPILDEDRDSQALNLIFRFNINYFLFKADNPTHNYLKVDPVSFKFIRATLPKVYHINIIMKNTYLDENQKNVDEYKKFRLIIDKNGIKRIELPNPSII